MNLLDVVLEYVGGNKAELARELQVSRSLINRFEKEGFIPEEYALSVEELTQGEVGARQVLIEARKVRFPEWLDEM